MKKLVLVLGICFLVTGLFAQTEGKKFKGHTLVVEKDDSTSNEEEEEFNLENYFNPNLSEEQREKFKAAIREFTRQIEENPEDIQGYLNRAQYFQYLGLHVQAIKDYDKAAELFPSIAIIYYNRAQSKARFFYTLDACKDLKKAYDLGFQQAKAVIDRQCGRFREELEATDEANQE